MTNKVGQPTGFRGTVTVDFYHEVDAQLAERALHCSEVRGMTISVCSGAERSIRASVPAFVPRGMTMSGAQPIPQPVLPPLS